MRIEKPEWLRRWLAQRNYTILTWTLNIGDWIEYPIDWLLEKINNIVDWWITNWNWAVYNWNRTLDELAYELREFVGDLGRIWDKINNWWTELAQWWEAKTTEVTGWVDEAKQWASDRIDEVKITLNKLDVWWDDFRVTILPYITPLLTPVGLWLSIYSQISDWWAARHREVSDETDAKVQPLAEQVNQQASLWDLIRDFAADPEKFIYQLVDRIIERFW